ncbi:hypothetical protein IU443_15780 [Nocardia farcinica]|uniref:Uncharacterized protein n=2 Tax=Nocardia farcinica TaxID=37329 RepID=A0A0H5NZY6_NOCFR|nr:MULTISPECIES: hypothetical protein [Nocardia]AXK86928.1 hypothetical protein DXT66_15990 [Nocardia farcinica]MBF6071821.1 hypothetical protein [Nocardia farcinica]MBF6143195.1 hypothetical protein [Nocardia farcinica]MBF6188404.1 hypothetical protein [Nocardia farcinica]MBF6233481.1 hypothetical protein [Nocardia farcinica]
MSANRLLFRGVLALALSLPALFLGAANAAADADVRTVAADYGGGCVLYPDNKAATLDSLRLRCSPEQQDAIFRDAPAGAVPMGVTNGWVVRPVYVQGIAPAFWVGKTFYTGPDGGFLMNRVTGAGLEAWRADVYRAPSLMDGEEAWALNYNPSPTPPLYDEIREVTPGVWLGYSWWRGFFQTTLLLTFALAN